MPKIYEDPEKAINDFFQKNKKYFVNILKHLPSEDLSHYSGPRIRKLYRETHYLTSLGFHNASIIMCGVLLEALLKDLVFLKKGKELSDFIEEKNADFGRAIKFCEHEGYITKDEADWLKGIKNEIRNPYIHSNIGKITKEKPVLVWEIKHTNIKELQDIIELIKSGKTAELIKSETIKLRKLTGKKLRAIDDVIKGSIDEKNSLPLFLKVDKFVRKIIERHFENI